MTDFDNTIRHAVIANHDGKLTSLVVLMVVKGKEPEMHMAVSSDDLHEMNTSCDLLKLELLRLINNNIELKKDRQ